MVFKPQNASGRMEQYRVERQKAGREGNWEDEEGERGAVFGGIGKRVAGYDGIDKDGMGQHGKGVEEVLMGMRREYGQEERRATKGKMGAELIGIWMVAARREEKDDDDDDAEMACPHECTVGRPTEFSDMHLAQL